LYLPLARYRARRFRNRGEPTDDLARVFRLNRMLARVGGDVRAGTVDGAVVRRMAGDSEVVDDRGSEPGPVGSMSTRRSLGTWGGALQRFQDRWNRLVQPGRSRGGGGIRLLWENVRTGKERPSHA
jgi:hypothetical protein